MTKRVIWIVLGLAMLLGCRSYTDFARSSSSDIPFHKRRPPSMEKAIIISSMGPQLYEAENVGADALINVSCSAEKYSAEAFGTAIIFKNREQALKALKEMKAILE